MIMKKQTEGKRGQGLVEYGLIIALVALIVLGVLVSLGKTYGPKIKIFVIEQYRFYVMIYMISAIIRKMTLLYMIILEKI